MMASILPLPSKLKQHGKALSDRFREEESPLYDEQKKALESLAKWFSEDNEKNGVKTKDYTAVVSMPTGTGKTGVMCCLPYYLGGADVNIDFTKPILVIAPGLIILNQLEENFDSDPFLMKSHINLIKLPDETHLGYSVRPVRKTADVNALAKTAAAYDIILTNAQKWRRDKTSHPNYEDLPADLFSVIIVDEAHHLPANQWQDIIDKFKKHAKIIFFTATPYRVDGKEVTPALTTVGLAYNLLRQEAIKAKLIRDVKWHDTYETPPCKKNNTSAESAKQVLAAVKERMQEKNRISPLPGGKKHASIIAAYSIEEAEKVRIMCQEELKFDPNSITLVNSKKNERANDRIIEEIKSGKYELVIIVNMLLEGFDYPPFSIAGIVTGIRSKVKFAQFIGRVQRVVRGKNADGEDETEKNIKADVITHPYFKQERLFKEYCDPKIAEEEDKTIDNEDTQQ